MPIPKPNDGESRDEFMDRCMSAVSDEFDDNDQRLAVCQSQWRGKMNLYQFDPVSPPTERKSIVFDSFEVGKQTKEIEGEEFEVASFEGVANVMEHEDLGGDIVHKGAFKKTLEEKGGKVPFVTDHTYKISNYAGVAHLSEQGNELKATVEVLLTDNPAGKEFYTKAKFSNANGDPFGLSIGYDIPKGKAETKDGVRHIYEVKLWEVSGVLFPMNELSRAVGFKDLHKYSRTDLLNAKQIIESLLNGEPPKGTSDEPSEDTHEQEADLLKNMSDKLKQLNKS